MQQTRMGTRLITRLVLGTLLAGGSGSSYALGLGRLTLHSHLNEPLKADIEVTSSDPNEIKTFQAALAPRSEFETAGIDRPPFLFDIKYHLNALPGGGYVLELTSDQPVREPFLHFLLQVNWQGGQLVREYTALLDPPASLAGTPPAVEAPRVEAAPVPAPAPQAVVEAPPAPVAPAPVVTAPALATVAPQASAAPAPAISQAPEQAAPPAEEPLLGPPDVPAEVMTEAAPAPAAPKAEEEHDYGPVKRGETASGVARKVTPDKALDLEQVTIALLRANPNAFGARNVNNLKVGAILKVPSRTDIDAIPRAAAVKEFKAQFNAWREYKLKTATRHQATPPPATRAGQIAKPGASAATAPAKTTAGTAAGDQDLLKIVRANLDESSSKTAGGTAPDTKAAAKNPRALLEKVATLEETLDSKEQENKALRDRVAALEAQVKTTQRLIDIQNKEAALMQKQAAEKPATTQAAPATPAPAASVPAAKPVVAPKPQPKKPLAMPVPAPQKSAWREILDDVGNNPFLFPLLGALAAIMGGGALLYYRRRRRSLAEFEESILSGGGVNTENNLDAGSQPQAADVSILSDFSQGGMGNMHTDEVDPIAEAEVYIAYGRDEQAEDILKEAVVKDPARHELRLKLLEIYHHRNDLAAFETVAEELYAALEGKGGKLWEKAEEMGRKMNPENPLFAGQGKAVPMAAVAPVAAAAVAAAAAPAASASPEETLDFDIDFGTTAEAPAQASARDAAPSLDAGLSFDMDFAKPGDASGMAAAPAAAGFDLDLSGLGGGHDANAPIEFSPQLEAGPEAEVRSTAELSASPAWSEGHAAETNGLIDQASPDGEIMNETATKLDLAKAYIDMGDAEGARSILDEVMSEGNEQQKRQARDLAAQIA